jgi:hypothetical protein
MENFKCEVSNQNESKRRKRMNKRMRITVFAICAMLMCLTVTTALAATISSTATVDYGVTSWRQGPERSLNSNSLSGTVKSTNGTGLNDQKLEGKMWSKGSVFAVCRDSASVSPNGSASLYWSNNDDLTGTFFSEARAQNGNHDGTCKVSQSGH